MKIIIKFLFTLLVTTIAITPLVAQEKKIERKLAFRQSGFEIDYGNLFKLNLEDKDFVKDDFFDIEVDLSVETDNNPKVEWLFRIQYEFDYDRDYRDGLGLEFLNSNKFSFIDQVAIIEGNKNTFSFGTSKKYDLSLYGDKAKNTVTLQTNNSQVFTVVLKKQFIEINSPLNVSRETVFIPSIHINDGEYRIGLTDELKSIRSLSKRDQSVINDKLAFYTNSNTKISVKEIRFYKYLPK